MQEILKLCLAFPSPERLEHAHGGKKRPVARCLSRGKKGGQTRWTQQPLMPAFLGSAQIQSFLETLEGLQSGTESKCSSFKPVFSQE